MDTGHVKNWTEIKLNPLISLIMAMTMMPIEVRKRSKDEMR